MLYTYVWFATKIRKVLNFQEILYTINHLLVSFSKRQEPYKKLEMGRNQKPGACQTFPVVQCETKGQSCKKCFVVSSVLKLLYINLHSLCCVYRFTMVSYYHSLCYVHRFTMVSYCHSTRRVCAGAKHGGLAFYDLKANKTQVSAEKLLCSVNLFVIINLVIPVSLQSLRCSDQK